MSERYIQSNRVTTHSAYIKRGVREVSMAHKQKDYGIAFLFPLPMGSLALSFQTRNLNAKYDQRLLICKDPYMAVDEEGKEVQQGFQ